MRTPVAVGGLLAFLLIFLCNVFFNAAFTLVLLSALLLLLVVSLVLIKKASFKKLFFVILICVISISSFSFVLFFRYLPTAKYYNEKLTVKGIVYEEPDVNKTSVIYILKPISACYGEKEVKLYGNIKLADYSGLNAEFFDVINCDIEVREPEDTSLFGLDMQDKSKSIYLSAIIKSAEITNENAKKDLNYYSGYIRSSVKAAVNKYVTADSRSIATIITTGDKSELTEEVKAGFVKSGLMHLTAVSGTHFVYILGFILFLFDILQISRRKTYAVCMALGAFICMAAGFSPSVMRAFLVMVIMNAGLLIYREIDPLNSLMAAAVIIFIFSPFSAGGLSLILSLLASIGIITVSAPFANFLEIHFFRKMKRKIWGLRAVTGILCSTFAATLFTVPVSACCFQYISVISPITNILVVPPASFLPVIVFIMTAFSAIPFAAGIFGFITGLFTDYIYLVLKWVLKLKLTLVFADKPYVYIVSGFLILFYLLCHFKVIKFSRVTATLVSAALLLTCFTSDYYISLVSAKAADNPLVIKFIDVGQGDSTLVAKNRLGVLIDGGGDYYAPESITNEMENAKVEKLQAIILTHTHSDHINAISSVIRYFKPSLLVLPKTDDENNTTLDELITSALSSGAAIKNADKDLKVDAIKDVSIEVLTGHVLSTDQSDSENDFSNVIKVTGYNVTTFIMGDVDETLWRFLKYYKGNVRCNILRVGHHGSYGTVTNDLLLQMQPSYAIISVGADNSYGLPNQNTVDMLKNNGIPVFTTAESKTITARISSDSTAVFYGQGR